MSAEDIAQSEKLQREIYANNGDTASQLEAAREAVRATEQETENQNLGAQKRY